MKTRKLVLLIADGLLLIALILQILLASGDKVKIYELKDQPDEISITSPDESFTLVKEDGHWFVGEKKYPANDDYVEHLLDSLTSVKVMDKVAIANNEKVCKIIHLPLQSGNTKVLKEMNRKYTKEQYLELANKIKNRVPNVVLSTDIIVGFPGETEEEFEDTLDVVRKVNYEQIFMFIYSPREGTVAAKRDDQIPEEIKHQRFDRLKDLYDSHVDENNEKYIGTNQKVLIEGYSKNNQEMYTARTDTNKVVVFKPIEGQKIGDIVTVKITSAHKWYLKAEIISR